MVFDLYHLLTVAVRLRRQNMGRKAVSVFRAYARLIMKRRWATWTKQTYTSETFLGYELLFFDYSSFVYLVEEIFINGLYRFDAKTDAPVILDCGSNIGMSILYFKWWYPRARIVAFEPDPTTFALLQRNISANGITDVEIHNLALSDCSGEVLFHRQMAGDLSASVFEGRVKEEVEACLVPSQPLSTFISGPIDLMKMDIEGAEVYCIPELARSGCLTQISRMVIECHHNIPIRSDILTTVLSVLEKYHFSYQLSSSVKSQTQFDLSQDVMLYANQPA